MVKKMIKNLIISLDPGHGGRDPGAIGATGTLEKEICLAIALQVRELLKTKATIHMTRETDIFIPLSRRTAPLGASCFVSIHCNAHHSRTANGIETFRPISGNSRSMQLALSLQRNLLGQLQLRDRTVKVKDFRVLKQAHSPAALVELGFISNPTEETLLSSRQGQKKAAYAIADGIAEFLGISI